VQTGDLTGKAVNLLQADTELPYSATYYPLGFPVQVTTNSREVLECAAESWGMWSAEFDRQPARLSVIVQDDGDLAPEPAFRWCEHLFSIVSDNHNYAVMDLDQLFSYACVSRRTVADHAWFRWFFLDTMGLFLLAQRYVTAVHAACVERDGVGILLAGESCAGKSTLAWACARAGWTYIGDDSAWILTESRGRQVRGRPYLVRLRHDAPRLFPELEGFVSRVRPNGKLSIEVPTSAFPAIRTAAQSSADAIVFLDRGTDRQAGFERITAAEAESRLMADLELHRDDVRARYCALVRRLVEAPAFRLRYKNLEEGITLLGELHASLRA
jgi:hypothetical protein